MNKKMQRLIDGSRNNRIHKLIQMVNILKSEKTAKRTMLPSKNNMKGELSTL